MKRRTIIQPAERAATDTRREWLLDEALREMAQPAPVDLKARVMAAIGEAPQNRTAEGAPASRRAWRPALAFAAAGAIVLVMLAALWPRPSGPGAAIPPSAAVRPDAVAAPLTASSAPLEVPDSSRDRGRPRLTVARREAEGGRTDAALVTPVPAATEPYLPGAPAGDLGDPLAPLPAPPAIGFAPITQAPISSAPSVSDIARPVTDFPADTASSDAPARGAGQSGGTRR